MELELKDFKEDEILYLKSCMLFRNFGEDNHDTLNYIGNLSAHLKAANTVFNYINCNKDLLIDKLNKFEKILSYKESMNVGERLSITVKQLLKYINLYKEVSSLKDLDGLQNGLGLTIEVNFGFINKEKYDITIYNKNSLGPYIKNYEDIPEWDSQVIINDLKAFGFMFDLIKEEI